MAAVPPTSGERIAVLFVADSGAQMKALVDALGSTREEELPSGTLVEHGVVAARDGALSVAAVEIDPTNAAAASTAQEVTMRLQPTFMLLVGLADGICDVRPGDVVAAERVYGFASGKAGARRLSLRPDLGRSSYRLVQRAKAEARRSDWLLFLDPPPVGDDAPRAFVNPVAAGDVVVDSSRAAIFKFLREHYNDALAVETAGRGFLEPAYQNKLDVLVIRAIRKALHGDLAAAIPAERAAKHAAAFALSLVARLSVGDPASVGEGERRQEPKYASEADREIAEVLRQCQEERRTLLTSRAHRDVAKRIEIDKAVADLDARILSLRERLRSGPQLVAGERLGDRYEVIESIGVGGFGTVWRAWDELDHRHVALKVLHGHLANDKTARERFYRGARRMAELRHPHIIGVRDTGGVDRGFHYFGMELVEGNLREAVSGSLELPDRIRVIAEVARALQYTHERGIIHRDVKPDNILIDETLSAHLTDFDLVHVPGTIAGTGAALGSLGFTAPEVLVDPKQATVQSDIYSLGVTAVFAIAGALPSVRQLFRNHYAVVGRLDCPLALKPILARALEWRPRDRFASMADFEAALQTAALRMASHGDVEAPPTPPSIMMERVEYLAGLDEAAWDRLLRLLRPVDASGFPPGSAPPKRRAIALARFLSQGGSPAIVDVLSAEISKSRATATPAAPASTQASEDGDDWEALIDALTAMDIDGLQYLILRAEVPLEHLSTDSQWRTAQDFIEIGKYTPEIMGLVGEWRARQRGPRTHDGDSRRPVLAAATLFAKMQLLLGRLERAWVPGPAIVERVSALIRARRFAEFIAEHDILAIDFYRRLPRHAPENDYIALPYLNRLRTLVEELPARWTRHQGDKVGSPVQDRRGWIPAYRVLCRAPAAAFEAAVRVFVDPSLLPFEYRERSTRVLALLRMADKWLGAAAEFVEILESQTTISCANADLKIPPFPSVGATMDRLQGDLPRLPRVVLDELSFRVGADFVWEGAPSVTEAAGHLSQHVDAKVLERELGAVLGHLYGATAVTAGENRPGPSVDPGELLDSVCLLDATQFTLLVERLGIPEEYLPPGDSELATRSIALLNLMDFTLDGLFRVATNLQQVRVETSSHADASRDERTTS